MGFPARADTHPAGVQFAGFEGRRPGRVWRMIRFSCKCGLEFNLPEDRAGSMVQCPRCALLVDVPTADELAWMSDDGTLAVDGDAAGTAGHAVPGQTLAQMYRAYSRKLTHADGVPIDLRPDYADDAAAPVVETHRPERIAPRYDPVTGERIIPLALKDEPPTPVIPLGVLVDPSELDPLPFADEVDAYGPTDGLTDGGVRPVMAIPVAAVPVRAAPVRPLPVRPVRPAAGAVPSLAYATGATGRQVTARTLAIDLLTRPANLTVLFFVFWFYALAVIVRQPLELLAGVGHLSGAAVLLLDVPLWLLAAHYGCVVEDIGPDAIDELPRPLRNFSVGDDLFAPGLRVVAALLICYGPLAVFAAVTGLARPAEGAVAVLLAAAGSALFPAVVLTLVTGTTVLNLTPARVAGVAAACGGQYLLSAAAAAAALALTAAFVLGPDALPALGRLPHAHATQRFTVIVPGLALTAYATHLFAWHLGLMYRAHHDSFPWLAQRHVRAPRPDRPSPPRAV